MNTIAKNIIITALSAQTTVVSAQQQASKLEITTPSDYVLPIANEHSSVWNEKKVQKGLTAKVIKDLFFEKDLLEEEEDLVGEFSDYVEIPEEKTVDYVVFSSSGAKAIAPRVFANAFGKDAADIKGRKVQGADPFVIKAVQAQDEAVSFSFADLVFSGDNGAVAVGIKVLPFDINGDGRVNDDERYAITSLSAFTEYVNHSKKGGLIVVK